MLILGSLGVSCLLACHFRQAFHARSSLQNTKPEAIRFPGTWQVRIEGLTAMLSLSLGTKMWIQNSTWLLGLLVCPHIKATGHPKKNPLQCPAFRLVWPSSSKTEKIRFSVGISENNRPALVGKLVIHGHPQMDRHIINRVLHLRTKNVSSMKVWPLEASRLCTFAFSG